MDRRVGKFLVRKSDIFKEWVVEDLSVDPPKWKFFRTLSEALAYARKESK